MRVPAYSNESASTGTSSSAKPPCSLSSACSDGHAFDEQPHAGNEMNGRDCGRLGWGRGFGEQGDSLR